MFADDGFRIWFATDDDADSVRRLAERKSQPPTTGRVRVALGGVRRVRVLVCGAMVCVAAGLLVPSSALAATPAFTQVADSPLSTTPAQPDSVAFSPSGGLLAAVNLTNGVEMFSVNSSTGAVKQVPGSPFDGPGAFEVAFSPAGGLLATANGSDDSVSMYSVNSSTGALSQVAGSPFHVGSRPVPQ
jgi:DNA-binding beta-propeller fold protein YncE